MPRRNRVDPWGDLHPVASRGLLTGNRGRVVDDQEREVGPYDVAEWTEPGGLRRQCKM